MFNLKSLLIIVLVSSSYPVQSRSIESIECEFCKKLFGYVYNLLDEDRAIKSIENALDTVCGQIFPSDQAATCEKYVDEYTAMIVDLVVKTTDPDQACTLLQLCGSSSQSESLLELVAEKIVETAVRNDRCNSCLIDVRSLQTDLKLAREEHIPKLRECCGQFPTPDGACDSYIETVGPIYDALESKIVPEEACGTFGICSSSQVNPAKQSTVGKIEPDCALCKQVFRLVDKVINKQAKIDIEAAFDKVCNTIVPSGSRKACRNLVDKYTTQLINFIAKHADPDTTCKFIGMCNVESDYSNDLTSLTSFPKTSNDCDNCNKSVSWAAVTINGYATSLNGMLENICLEYAHDYDLCSYYIVDNINSLTDELIAKTSSDNFCTNIFGLCPRQKQN